MASGNACSVGQTLFDDVLDTASGIVKRDWFNSGMMAKEVAALVESHGMGERAAHRTEFYAGRRDQVMHDTQAEFALNEDVPRHQQIGVLCYGPGQRVLDWKNRRRDRSFLQAVKNFNRARTRDNSTSRQHAFRRFVAEASEFALYCDLHCTTFSVAVPSQGKVAGEALRVQLDGTLPLTG